LAEMQKKGHQGSTTVSGLWRKKNLNQTHTEKGGRGGGKETTKQCSKKQGREISELLMEKKKEMSSMWAQRGAKGTGGLDERMKMRKNLCR